MNNFISDTSQNKTTRLAGFLYLIVAAYGMFAELYVSSKLIVSEKMNSDKSIQKNKNYFLN